MKWDTNRDHVHASGAIGRARTHAQTLALDQLLDELRRRLLGASEDELAHLAGWVEMDRMHRELLHFSDVLRIDHDDPHALVDGVRVPVAVPESSHLIALTAVSNAGADS